MRLLKSIVINLEFIHSFLVHSLIVSLALGGIRSSWWNSKLENVEKNCNCNISLNSIYTPYTTSFPGCFSLQSQGKARLQNSPYFCVFKYARAVKQKVSPHTPYGLVRLARFARVRLLSHALPISLLILRKKSTVLQSMETRLWQLAASIVFARILRPTCNP